MKGKRWVALGFVLSLASCLATDVGNPEEQRATGIGDEGNVNGNRFSDTGSTTDVADLGQDMASSDSAGPGDMSEETTPLPDTGVDDAGYIDVTAQDLMEDATDQGHDTPQDVVQDSPTDVICDGVPCDADAEADGDVDDAADLEVGDSDDALLVE